MPTVSFVHRDFVRKPYIVSITVIIGKLLYAVSAWLGIASAADRQRLQALLQCGICSGLCSAETTHLTELAESIDDALFQRNMHNPYHALHHLLPERRELVVYNIRPRHQLSIISGQLRNRNFMYRVLLLTPFSADRTNGRANATVLRLSLSSLCLSSVVCGVMYCG